MDCATFLLVTFVHILGRMANRLLFSLLTLGGGSTAVIFEGKASTIQFTGRGEYVNSLQKLIRTNQQKSSHNAWLAV